MTLTKMFFGIVAVVLLVVGLYYTGLRELQVDFTNFATSIRSQYAANIPKN